MVSSYKKIGKGVTLLKRTSLGYTKKWKKRERRETMVRLQIKKGEKMEYLRENISKVGENETEKK